MKHNSFFARILLDHEHSVKHIEARKIKHSSIATQLDKLNFFQVSPTEMKMQLRNCINQNHTTYLYTFCLIN